MTSHKIITRPSRSKFKHPGHDRVGDIIDIAIASSNVERGRVMKNSDILPIPAHLYAAMKVDPELQIRRMPSWSTEEDRFLRDNMGTMTDVELGEALGRSPTAVHLRWERDLGLPARSKAPGILTGEQVSLCLGVDSHKVAGWFDVGMIKGHVMPGGEIRLITRTAFYMWACNPMNWVYFDIHAVQDLRLKKLLLRKEKIWGDEWWRTTKVAEYHGVDVGDVKRYIVLGRLRSFRPPYSIGGRHRDRKWGYHFVLKSEAVKAKFFRGKGSWGASREFYEPKFTPAADAFILHAIDILKLSTGTVGKLMKIGRLKEYSNPTIAFRYKHLKREQEKAVKKRTSKKSKKK